MPLPGGPVERFLGVAEGAHLAPRPRGDQWQMHCPGSRHRRGDKNPSLWLREGEDFRALLVCRSMGCPVEDDILPRLGLTARDLYHRDDRAKVVQLRHQPRTIAEALGTAGPSAPPAIAAPPAIEAPPASSSPPADDPASARGRTLGQLEAEYEYRDAAGQPVGKVRRYNPKDFRPFTPDGAGGWRMGGSIPPVPYRLPEVIATLAAGGLVVIVEGEKDADALAEFLEAKGIEGVTATTNAGGAGKWTPQHSRAIADAMTEESAVCIVGDTDAAGQEHVRKVRASLAAVGVDAAVQWPARGKDLAEHLANGGTLEELRDGLGDDAEPEPDRFPLLGPVLSIDDLAKLPPIRPLIKQHLSMPSGAILIGPYGLGKTAITVAMAACVASGKPFLGHQVEQARTLYVIGEGARGMARRVRAWEQTWQTTIPRDALSFMIRPHGKLHKPDTWHELWAFCKAEGYRFIVLDTLSALAAGADETKDAAVIIDGLQGLAEEVNGTALLVHHTGWSDKTRGRGGSQLEADTDEVLLVNANSQGSEHLALTVKKAKDDESGRVHHMRRIVVPLGHDQDGEPIASVTVEHARAADGAVPLSERVLVHLADVETEGASKSQLAEACEVKPSNGALARAVRELVSAGKIRREGTGNRTRYYATAR